MFVLGLLLIVAGIIGILAAIFDSSGTASLLGADLGARTIFILGVVAGAAILWGFTISKFGARRSIRQRRESKRLRQLSDKLDRADGERGGRPDAGDSGDSSTPRP